MARAAAAADLLSRRRARSASPYVYIYVVVRDPLLLLIP
jgi:hypothetical protein